MRSRPSSPDRWSRCQRRFRDCLRSQGLLPRGDRLPCAAEAELMAALHPGKSFRKIFHRRVAARVGRRGGDTRKAVSQARVIASPLGVKRGRGSAVGEEHRAARRADAEFIGQSRRKRGAQRQRSGEPAASLAGVDVAAKHRSGTGKYRINAVQKIGRRSIHVVIHRVSEVMLLSEVVIDAARPKGARIQAGWLLAIGLPVVIVVAGDQGFQIPRSRVAPDLVERLQDNRIGCRSVWHGRRPAGWHSRPGPKQGG